MIALGLLSLPLLLGAGEAPFSAEDFFHSLDQGPVRLNPEDQDDERSRLAAYLRGDDRACVQGPMDPSSSDLIRILRCFSLIRLNLADQACAELEALLQARPHFGLAQAELAALLKQAGRVQEAAELWSRARKNDITLTAATLEEGRSWAELGEGDRAYLALARAGRERPWDGDAHRSLRDYLSRDPLAPDRNEKKKEEYRQQVLGRALPPLPWAGGPLVRVGLAERGRSFRVRSSSCLDLMSESGRLLASWLPGRDLEIPASLKEIPALRKLDVLRLVPEQGGGLALLGLARDSGSYWGYEQDMPLRGELELTRRNAGWTLVNILRADLVVLGQLAGEMPPSYPQEALTAQAVAARSDLMSRLGLHRKQGFDVCSGVHCAAFRGSLDETESYYKAVRDSAGLVLAQDGRPAATFYVANCGGWGHGAEEAWAKDENGPGRPLPDLKEGARDRGWGLEGLFSFLREDPGSWCGGEGGQGAHRWIVRIPARDILARIKAAPSECLRGAKILSRDGEGYVRSLELRVGPAKGRSRARRFSRDSVRTALPGARSNLFFLLARAPAGGLIEEVLLLGGGWGHGVGFCQQGARGRAQAGQGWKEILAAYFPDLTVQAEW